MSSIIVSKIFEAWESREYLFECVEDIVQGLETHFRSYPSDIYEILNVFGWNDVQCEDYVLDDGESTVHMTRQALFGWIYENGHASYKTLEEFLREKELAWASDFVYGTFENSIRKRGVTAFSFQHEPQLRTAMSWRPISGTSSIAPEQVERLFQGHKREKEGESKLRCHTALSVPVQRNFSFSSRTSKRISRLQERMRSLFMMKDETKDSKPHSRREVTAGINRGVDQAHGKIMNDTAEISSGLKVQKATPSYQISEVKVQKAPSSCPTLAVCNTIATVEQTQSRGKFNGDSFKDEFVKFLGRGSFGFVLKIKNNERTFSAVKAIFPEKGNDTDDKYIMRESGLMNDKKHKNVVEIIGVSEEEFNANQLEILADVINDEGVEVILGILIFRLKRKGSSIKAIFIEMELCYGNLREWLNKRQITSEDNQLITVLDQLEIIEGMVEGLQFLHDHGIIHRDIKPENVLFSCTEFLYPVKIGDFGLCRLLLDGSSSKFTTLTSRAGTLDYMAPEMNSTEYGLQADLYSLGLVIWEVVQKIEFRDRRRMFEELTIDGNTDAIKDDLPEGVKDVIIRLTKRKESERMQSVIKLLTIVKKWKSDWDIAV